MVWRCQDFSDFERLNGRSDHKTAAGSTRFPSKTTQNLRTPK